LLRLPLTPEIGVLALELQSSLLAAGLGRAVGIVDLLHAATAIVHEAVVIHYDNDFETLAGVEGRLRQAWIVPPGSVD
jgi:predicted nucleic acid-binding protein